MKNPTNYISLFSICLLMFCLHHPAMTQDVSSTEEEKKIIEIKLRDGSTISGELWSENEDHFVINNASLGEMTILRTKIESFRILEPENFVGGEYWHSSSNSSRNIFTPNGYGLREGEGYYQNFMLFVNQFSYGFTDNFSMGIGFEIASLLFRVNNRIEGDDGGVSLPGFMLTPKFSIPIKENKWNLGIGGMVLGLPETGNFFDLGLVYGLSTWGSRNNNFTIGIGMGASEEGISKRPVITASGTIRVAKRLAFNTENWFLNLDNETGYLNTVSLRYLGDRISVDLGITGAGDTEHYFISPIPLVGLVIPFGTGWGK